MTIECPPDSANPSSHPMGISVRTCRWQLPRTPGQSRVGVSRRRFTKLRVLRSIAWSRSLFRSSCDRSGTLAVDLPDTGFITNFSTRKFWSGRTVPEVAWRGSPSPALSTPPAQCDHRDLREDRRCQDEGDKRLVLVVQHSGSISLNCVCRMSSTACASTRVRNFELRVDPTEEVHAVGERRFCIYPRCGRGGRT